MGRALRRREARFPEGRAVLLLSGLVGRRPDDPQLHQPRQMERAAASLPVAGAHRLVARERMDAGEIRRRQSGRAQAPRRGGRAAAPIPAADDGRLVARSPRPLCRSVADQRRLQEGVGSHAGVPQRPVSVVAGRRAQLRQLSGAQSQPHVTGVAKPRALDCPERRTRRSSYKSMRGPIRLKLDALSKARRRASAVRVARGP